MTEDLINLIILNNPSSYNLKFAGIAYQKNKKDKCLLIIFREDDELIQRQYKSVKSAKIGFAKKHKWPGKEFKPDWSSDILRYTYRRGNEGNRRTE